MQLDHTIHLLAEHSHLTVNNFVNKRKKCKLSTKPPSAYEIPLLPPEEKITFAGETKYFLKFSGELKQKVFSGEFVFVLFSGIKNKNR